MNTYIIEEVATYYLKARSKREAERIFLDSIRTPATITCEVHEREVYRDPENRTLPKKPKKPSYEEYWMAKLGRLPTLAEDHEDWRASIRRSLAKHPGLRRSLTTLAHQHEATCRREAIDQRTKKEG